MAVKRKIKTARLIGWYGKWKVKNVTNEGRKKHKKGGKKNEGNKEGSCNNLKTKRGEA